VIGRQIADIVDNLHLRDVVMAFYGVHIDATLRIRVNRPYAAAMRPYVKLL